MPELPPQEQMDRHALVMAIWTPVLFVSAILLHKGLASGGWWIFAGFATIILGFVGHIILNVLLKTSFTQGETAFGSFAFGLALFCLILTGIVAPELLGEGGVLKFGLGLASLVVACIAYMVIAFGPRGAFERFDIIRDNYPRASSRLPHRGGRR